MQIFYVIILNQLSLLHVFQVYLNMDTQNINLNKVLLQTLFFHFLLFTTSLLLPPLNVLSERSNCHPDTKFHLSFGECIIVSSTIFLLLNCNSIFPLPSTGKEKPSTATDILVFVTFSNVVKRSLLHEK